MADGKGCSCDAYAEFECACGADWTPQEVYDLREKNEKLRDALIKISCEAKLLNEVPTQIMFNLLGIIYTIAEEALAALDRILK